MRYFFRSEIIDKKEEFTFQKISSFWAPGPQCPKFKKTILKYMRKRSTKVEILVDIFRQTYFWKFDENLVYPGLLNKTVLKKRSSLSSIPPNLQSHSRFYPFNLIEKRVQNLLIELQLLNCYNSHIMQTKVSIDVKLTF